MDDPLGDVFYMSMLSITLQDQETFEVGVGEDSTKMAGLWNILESQNFAESILVNNGFSTYTIINEIYIGTQPVLTIENGERWTFKVKNVSGRSLDILIKKL